LRAFAFQRFVPPALSRATAAARVLDDSRPGHGPAHRAGHERAYPAGRLLRAGRRAVLVGDLPLALSLAPQGAHEGASERRWLVELVVVDSHGWRVVVSEEDAE